MRNCQCMEGCVRYSGVVPYPCLRYIFKIFNMSLIHLNAASCCPTLSSPPSPLIEKLANLLPMADSLNCSESVRKPTNTNKIPEGIRCNSSAQHSWYLGNGNFSFMQLYLCLRLFSKLCRPSLKI